MSATLTEVATAEPWEDGPPPTATHAAFTYSGLADARASPRTSSPPSRPSSARAWPRAPSASATAARARPSTGRPAWAPARRTCSSRSTRSTTSTSTSAARCCASSARRHGATTVINETRAEALPGGKDHFGFFDGIAQPAVAGSGVEARPGDGQPDGAGGWRDVCTGEFLHGHIDEDGGLPDAPAAPFRPQRDVRGLPQAPDRRRGLPRLHGGEGARLPGRSRHARGQDRRALERRDAARALPRRPRPRHRRRPGAHQRLLLRRRPGGPALPARARTSAAPTRATPRASSRAA